jgi:hypothetical protein
MSEMAVVLVIAAVVAYGAFDVWWTRRCAAAVDAWNSGRDPRRAPDDPTKKQMY